MSDFLSLEKYFLQELNIQAPIPQETKTGLSVNLNTNLIFEKNAHSNDMYKVTLSCEIEHKEFPDYKIKATIAGIFKTGNKCENKEMRDRLLSNGASSTLYGVLREIIRSITSQTIYPPLILPIIHFEERKISFTDEDKN